MRLVSRDVAGAARALVERATRAKPDDASVLATAAIALAVLEVARELAALRLEAR